MNHILQECPRRRYGGGLNDIPEATKEAIDKKPWFGNLISVVDTTRYYQILSVDI